MYSETERFLEQNGETIPDSGAMSQLTRNRPATGTQVLREVEQLMASHLPPGWSMQSKKQTEGRQRADSVVRVTAPDGEIADFIIEAKRSTTPQALQRTIEQLLAYAARSDLPRPQLLVAASYLSPRSRKMLAERGISYADATGNLRLTADQPGLFVELSGAAKDPWPDNLPLQSLRGRGSARAIRAVLDFRPPYGIRELAQRAHVSVATLSRVIDLLAREALLTKNPERGVVDVDWEGTIRRWSIDYDVRRSNSVRAYLEPRGLDEFTSRLGQAEELYAVTGSVAAQRFAPIVSARIAAVYVEDAIGMGRRLGLREVDSGANVLLVEPYDGVVFERTTVRNGLATVAPTQLAVDLLTGPGREPSEGEELLQWMESHEDEWRA